MSPASVMMMMKGIVLVRRRKYRPLEGGKEREERERDGLFEKKKKKKIEYTKIRIYTEREYLQKYKNRYTILALRTTLITLFIKRDITESYNRKLDKLKNTLVQRYHREKFKGPLTHAKLLSQ